MKGSFSKYSDIGSSKNSLICKQFAKGLEYCIEKILSIEGEICSSGQSLHIEWHVRNVEELGSD